MEKVASSVKSKKVLVGFNAFGSVYAEVPETDFPKDEGWNEPVVDLSDFTPLAELVRSFQPRDNAAQDVEFDYPDGEEDGDSWTAPQEYADPTDAFEAINAEKASLEKKSKFVSRNAEVLNADSTAAKSQAVEKASGSSGETISSD